MPDLALPLLAKDLRERSARFRTFSLRALAAILLYAGFLLLFGDRLNSTEFADQGGGAKLLDFVMNSLFVAVYLFIPAGLVGGISRDRSTGNLPLMLLTGLGGRRLVIEKILSGLVPIGTWLLLTLPLLAVATSMGGVETWQLVYGIACVAVAGVMVSAFVVREALLSPDPDRALLRVYVRMAVILVGLFSLFSIGLAFAGAILGSALGGDTAMLLPAGLFPYIVFQLSDQANVLGLMLGLLPSAIAAGLFTLMAAPALETAVRKPPKRSEDQHLASIMRGPRWQVPRMGNRPIAWLERARLISAIGLRNASMALAMIVILLLIALTAGDVRRGESMAVSVAVFGVYIALALGSVVTTTSALASERNSGVLDVLLTTPLAGQEVVSDKLTAARKLNRLAVAPLSLLWLVALVREWNGGASVVYMLASLAAVTVYPACLAWLTALLSLRLRHRSRAMIVCLVAVVVWCVVPAWLSSVVGVLGLGDASFLSVASPAMGLAMIEYPREFAWHGSAVGSLVTINLFLHAALWAGLRFYVLRNADRLLGRSA
jgi:hypothetical protein